MLRGSNETERASPAVDVHLMQRVGQERMPVAHPDVHRQWMAGCRQALGQARGLAPGERGDRRHSAEELVVTGHFLDPLRQHSTAAKHVRQKRTDVVRALWPTERNEQNGIEHRESTGTPFYL